MEQRANIKFCVKLEKKIAETYELMIKDYGDDCTSRTQVYSWLTRFKNGRDDLNDYPRPGRPEASNRAELVEKVREIIAIDDYLIKLVTRLHEIRAIARDNLIAAKEKSKKYYDRNVSPQNFNVDEEVFLLSGPKPKKLKN